MDVKATDSDEIPQTAQQQTLASAPSSPAAFTASQDPVSHRGQTRPSQSIQFSSKYSLLKGMANLCNTLVIITVILASSVGLVGFIMLFTDEGELGLIILIIGLIYGTFSYVVFKILTEGILVLLDIEMNTRQTAKFTKYLVDHYLE